MEIGQEILHEIDREKELLELSTIDALFEIRELSILRGDLKILRNCSGLLTLDIQAMISRMCIVQESLEREDRLTFQEFWPN